MAANLGHTRIQVVGRGQARRLIAPLGYSRSRLLDRELAPNIHAKAIRFLELVCEDKSLLPRLLHLGIC
jgi:hypothetical protein